MTVNYQSSGTDLSSLFAPRVNAAGSNVNYRATTTDLSQTFEPISSANYNIASGLFPSTYIGQRIPGPTNIKSSGTDLASLFCGNIALYSISTPTFTPNPIVARTTSWTNTVTFTFTLTWSSTSNFTSFWNCGGRIQLVASRTGGSSTSANTSISNLLSTNLGTVVISDTATYITGNGANSVFTTARFGGTNFSSSLSSIASVTGQSSPYSGDTVVVKGQTNISQTELTISMAITSADSGIIGSTIDGTLTPAVQYRIYTGNTTYPVFNVTTNF